MLIKTPLLHQSSGPRVFFSLFFSLSLSGYLFLWSAEALWVHFPAWASKTLSRRCSVPSPHWEGASGLREQSKPHARGFIGFLSKPRNISPFSPLLSYRRLWTTRFQSIKGPQHRWTYLQSRNRDTEVENKRVDTKTCDYQMDKGVGG